MVFVVKTVKPTLVNTGGKPNDVRLKLKDGSEQNAINFFTSRYKTDVTLTDAPDGMYTWIISKEGTLFAAQPISNQELGTLHVNLAMFNDINREDVIAAGELRKEGPNVTFNLQSGSFMGQVYSKGSKHGDNAGGRAALEFPKKLAEEKFRSIGLNPIFNEAPMINAAPILTRSENYKALQKFFEPNSSYGISPPKKKQRVLKNGGGGGGGGGKVLEFGGGSRRTRRRRQTRRRHR